MAAIESSELPDLRYSKSHVHCCFAGSLPDVYETMAFAVFCSMSWDLS